MNASMSRPVILENLRLVAQWLEIKHAGRRFEIVIAGGAALALLGTKEGTIDVDVVHPERLPAEMVEAAQVVAKAKGLGPEWLSSGVARLLELVAQRSGVPAYFGARERRVDVAPNLTVWVLGRQALISLKLLAATPSARKHVDDLTALRPSASELQEGARFVRAYDPSQPTGEDLARVVRELGGSDDDSH